MDVVRFGPLLTLVAAALLSWILLRICFPAYKSRNLTTSANPSADSSDAQASQSVATKDGQVAQSRIPLQSRRRMALEILYNLTKQAGEQVDVK